MELINNGLGENKNSGYDRVDRWDERTTAKLTEHYEEILSLLGQNGDREGLKETPTRVAKAMQ
ncbi:MAG: GTP cyclohydrolase I, partial [Bacteroidales bacterium]|nr:GTP cyclohydrolase I [Bacteroidales bacterium]